MTETNLNMPALGVDEIVEQLSKMYIKAIKTRFPFKALPSIFLHGSPGSGKSDSVREIAAEIERETGKHVKVIDIRLLLMNPVDLRGIPSSNPEKTLTVWLKPKIFDLDPSPDVVNILFLDELTSASPQVQMSALQLTLDRAIGEFSLPDNTIVCCAGNKMTDKSVVHRLPSPLANRLLHIETICQYGSWKRWAVENGIHEKVLGFLSFRPDYLNCFDPKKDDYAFATPRSWAAVSNVLTCVDSDPDKVSPLISGLVGSGIAIEFKHYCRIYNKLPNIEDIFNGKCHEELPKEPDRLYALVSAMTGYAREHKNDYNLIGNAIYYAQAFPADFTVLFLKNLMAIEKNYLDKLKKIPEFYEFLEKKGAILNGAY